MVVEISVLETLENDLFLWSSNLEDISLLSTYLLPK